MELEFHAGFFKKLDFQQIEFFIETQFSKNRVSKQRHIYNIVSDREHFTGKFD